MELGQILPIALPIALAVLLAVALLALWRRAWATVARVREVEGFRHAISALEQEVDRQLGGWIERIDAVRRGQTQPGEVVADFAAALRALDGFAGASRAIETPPAFVPTQDAYTAELERAARSLAMVEHGCRVLVSAGGHRRQLEATTAIKRGYLNLLHSRTALQEHAELIATARDPLQHRWRTSRI